MNNVADKLYNILGTKFNNTDIKTLDSSGKETTDMEEIEMFSFDFLIDSRNYGPVVILLSAEENLEVYYGDNTSKSLDRNAKKKWENLIEHLSTFARSNRLGFSLKHTTDLKYDLSNITDITESYRNIFEGYYGTRKTSYSPQGKAKIIIKHSKAIGEDDKRFRNISQIFIENADGERFKLPFKKLAGARAMARHVTEGGNPYDLFGVHISEMVNDINTLGGFVRRSKMYEGNDEAMGMVETGRTHYNSLRKGLKQIAGVRGYGTYKEGWEPSEITEMETDTSAIRGMFMDKKVNQRTEDALPLLARLQQMAETQDLTELTHSTYNGFAIEVSTHKKGFKAFARNRAGEKMKPLPGKTEQDAIAAVHVQIDQYMSAQQKVSGKANVNLNAAFTSSHLRPEEDQIWAKLIAGPKLVVAGKTAKSLGVGYLKSEHFTKTGNRKKMSSETGIDLLGFGMSPATASSSQAIANARYKISDPVRDVNDDKEYDLEFDSIATATNDKVTLPFPALTVATARGIGEAGIEWPEEVKGDEFPGDTHPDQGDWEDDDDVMPHGPIGEVAGDKPSEVDMYNKIKDWNISALKGYARRIGLMAHYQINHDADESTMIDEIMGYLYDDNWERVVMAAGGFNEAQVTEGYDEQRDESIIEFLRANKHRGAFDTLTLTRVAKEAGHTISASALAEVLAKLEQEGRVSGVGKTVGLGSGNFSYSNWTVPDEMNEINEFEKWADGIVEGDYEDRRMRDGKRYAKKNAPKFGNKTSAKLRKQKQDKELKEGTWAVPETPEDLAALTAFLSKPQPMGIDGMNVTDALYDIIGDDSLFDTIADNSEDAADMDARVYVIGWIEDAIKNKLEFTNPAVIGNLKKALASAQNVQQEGITEAGDGDILAQAKHYGFRDYTGGHGPDQKQANNNTDALINTLERAGAKPKASTLDKVAAAEMDFADLEKVVIVGKRYASYDRWGFCGGQIKGQEILDQAGFEETFNYLTGKTMEEGCNNDLDADNETQLNASINKHVDAYAKTKDTNETVTESFDLNELMQRTNRLLQK